MSFFKWKMGSSASQHTPLPWKIKPWDEETRNADIYAEDVLIVSAWGREIERTEEATANAAFIVKACNNYAELVAAVQHALDCDEANIGADTEVFEKILAKVQP